MARAITSLMAVPVNAPAAAPAIAPAKPRLVKPFVKPGVVLTVETSSAMPGMPCCTTTDLPALGARNARDAPASPPMAVAAEAILTG